MADIRLQIPEEVIRGFQDRLGDRTKPTEITRDALTIYKWAVDEVAKGNVLLSANPDGTGLTKLAMPSLQSVRTTG